MLIILIVLFIAGFFFSPAWLIFVGLIIYLYSSREARRSKAIEGRIAAMVKAGVSDADFNEIYFNAAEGYAKSKGSKSYEAGTASAKVVIGNKVYSAFFIKLPNGGTHFSVFDNNRAESAIDKYVDSVVGVDIGHSPPEAYLSEKLSSKSLSNAAEYGPVDNDDEFKDEQIDFLNSDEINVLRKMVQANNYEQFNQVITYLIGSEEHRLDDFPMPSWVLIKDKEVIEALLNLIEIGGKVPLSYACTTLSIPQSLNIALRISGAAERLGANRYFQKQLLYSFMMFCWSNLPELQKERFIKANSNGSSAATVIDSFEHFQVS